jgi:hypothetical protein
MRATIARPENSEHAPFAITYINATDSALSEAGLADVRDLLAGQCDALETLLKDVSDEQANAGYAPGKWSLKESIVHMSDTERVFSYRAMRIARADETPLAAFEQDHYVPESRANARTLTDILAEFRAVRGASLALVNSFDETALPQVGTASNRLFSVRALCWIMAGHAAHHIGIARDRYLPALA